MKMALCLIFVTAMAAVASAHGDADTDAHQSGHGHEHAAPHGGTLIVLGDEFAHLELVLDPGTGEQDRRREKGQCCIKAEGRVECFDRRDSGKLVGIFCAVG